MNRGMYYTPTQVYDKVIGTGGFLSRAHDYYLLIIGNPPYGEDDYEQPTT